MNNRTPQENRNNFHNINLPKRFSSFLCTISASILLAVPVFLFLLPKENFSSDENRMLTTFPDFSADSLFDGQYTRQISSYLRDHLPGRSALLKTKALTEYTLLKKENNHVIFAQDAYLIKRFQYTDEQLSAFRNNIQTVAALKSALEAEGKPTVFVCAPRAIDVLASRCSETLGEPSVRSPWQILSDEDPEAVTLQDLLCQKADRGEKVWFRTDHHWTPLGAYYAYEALGTKLGYTPLPRDSFFEVNVSTSFLGTSFSASQFPIVRPDTVTTMRYAGDSNYTCTDVLTGRVRQGLYVEEALSGKDHYQYFLGANTAHLRIQRNNGESRPTLLLIKDSYAQCLAPFLARHFDIELIDLRYFRSDATETIRRILEKEGYAGTLILCNVDTLTSDVGFERINADNL